MTQSVDAPFAWSSDEEDRVASVDVEALTRRRVTQCALSRVCGVCAEPLGRPIAFVGTPEEVARNVFHAPPLHQGCAEGLLARVAGWELVTTAGFEYVRPGRDEPETRPTFVPNSLI